MRAKSGAVFRKVDAVVSTIDISPTVLELARFTDPLTKQFQGNSLVSLLNDPGGGDDRIAYERISYIDDLPQRQRRNATV